MARLAWQERALQSSQLRIAASTGQVALSLSPGSLGGLQSCWQPLAAWQVRAELSLCLGAPEGCICMLSRSVKLCIVFQTCDPAGSPTRLAGGA